MGKVREFWCWLAGWTLWPFVRGSAIAAIILIGLIVIAAIVSRIAVMLR